MPIVTITDVVRDSNDIETRERTIAVFGFVIYKLCECFPITKDRAIGFQGNSDLTFVED